MPFSPWQKVSRRLYVRRLWMLICTMWQAQPLLARGRRASSDQTPAFLHGVASGDPLPYRVILWTRISGITDASIAVYWQVGSDPEMNYILADGWQDAKAASDYTVKIDAALPGPGRLYYYRFRCGQTWSDQGRTRTAPLDAQPLRFGIVSCSSIWSGHFSAYASLAEREDLDCILHLGDYIYDTPDYDEYRLPATLPADAASPTDLSEVRARYAYYRRNSTLQTLHARHPMIVIWDNHDLEHVADKSATIQAFHEWMPIRSPEPGNPSRIYRSFDFGPHARILMLDTRHIARDQIDPETGNTQLLGPMQHAWMQNALDESSASWNIIGNQVLMAPLRIAGYSVNRRAWDGYTEERDQVLQLLAKARDSGNLILTGDAHMSFLNQLHWDNKVCAWEFLPSSVSRGNLDESFARHFKGLASWAVQRLVHRSNPHVHYFETEQHGYGLLELNAERAIVEFNYLPVTELCTLPERRVRFQIERRSLEATRMLPPPFEIKKAADRGSENFDSLNQPA